MRLAEAIIQVVGGAAPSYRGIVDDSTREQFDAIEWLDERSKPTWDEVAAMMASDLTAPVYDKLKLVDALDADGRLEDFDSLLSGSPLRIRLRWQAAGALAGDDPDLLTMIEAIQQAWGMTDEQRDALLEKCRIA